MNLDAQLATENLDARIAEELEERTEFCDWLSVCTSCCGGSTTTCTTGPSSTGSQCPVTPTKCP